MAFLMPTAVFGQGIAQTAHNLSASGPGNVRAQAETAICVFCHASHSEASAGMWNRRASSATYIPYSSSTAVAKPGQPTGTSILCLSCHDGTIALGEMINRSNAVVMSGGVSKMPQGRGNTGIDLTDDHPISFAYTASLAAQNGELALPGTFDSRLKLDGNGELQCTTCHTAHDNTYGAFLVKPNIGSQICTECHRKNGWSQTSHSLSAATWSGQAQDPWPDTEFTNVADNACQNCHMPHVLSGSLRLLRHAREEDNCSACHNGRVASEDVMVLIDEISSHRVKDTTLVHDPVEPAVVDSRHVECVDCHNSHATQSARVDGDVPANVRGVNLAGVEVTPAIATFQICLRCHGDSPNQPPARTPRQHDQANMRLKIQPENPSFHPIAGPGQNPNVPSLISPLTEQSIIGCGGCHNSSNAASAGGSGPEGPHGSAFEPILVRNYVTIDNTPESAANYALCYNCHSRNSILNDDSFTEHDKHVRGEDTPCNICHDPHGISTTQGNTTNNSHLINFDTSVVFPRGNGVLQFVDNGQFSGSCDLICHGEDHNNFDY
jgi:predicted CXXCH cytochrome family protein